MDTESNTANVAYKMALDLWFKEHGEEPRAGETNFLDHVRDCVAALTLRGPQDSVGAPAYKEA